MTTERPCKRCNGREILLAAESGSHISWKDSNGDAQGNWFCPDCDWGDSRASRDA